MQNQSAIPIFDFAIIGAGFAGLATAFYLGRAGRRGVIVEKADHIGAHASGRNAGMLRQLYNDLLIFELASRSRNFFDRPETRDLLTVRGSLLLTHEAKGQEQIRDYPKTSERLTRQQTLERFAHLQRLKFSSAAFTASDAVVDLQGLLAYFLGEAMASGFALRLSSQVRGASWRGDHVELDTSGGAVRARVVVNASGAWATPLAAQLGGESLSLTPMKRHISRQVRLADWPVETPFVWHLDDNYYLRVDGDSVLTSLCDETPTHSDDEQADADIEGRLQAHLARQCPPFAKPRLLESWACLRTFAADKRPVVGWDARQPWLFWVAGLGGTGVTTCAAIGEYAATLLVAGRAAGLAQNSGMQPERFASRTG